MRRPAVLTLLWMLWMLQWREAATEGQRGTDSSVFYAVEMEGGVGAAQSLAKQHGLQFISRVSAYLKKNSPFITSTYRPPHRPHPNFHSLNPFTQSLL